MSLVGRAKRVRIYVHEDAGGGQGPTPELLVDALRRESAEAATVLRPTGGEGGRRLPAVVEWVERPEVVERLLPRIRSLVTRGLVTVEDTEVVHHVPAMRELPHAMTAGDVMSRDVARVARDTPIPLVVEAMLGKSYRAVPVVEAGAPIGIITNADLVEKGGLGARLDLLKGLDRPELRDVLERLARSDRVAADVMTPSPSTVHEQTPLPDVASLMSRRRLKRLPVIDDRGMLVGMVSRVDLLRTVAGTAAHRAPAERVAGLHAETPLAKVVRRDVPLVHPAAPLAEVFQAVVATRLHRALVVDDAGHVVGIVTDAELLDRVTPSLRPGALRALMTHLPFAHPPDAAAARNARARTAAEIMSREVAVAREDAPVSEAVGLMLQHNQKVLAVTDAAGRLAGIVDRADLLHALAPE